MDEVGYDLYFQVLQVLERLAINYVIIGAFAGTSYGITRATVDIDMVVDLSTKDINELTSAFPSPRYYADPYQIRESIRTGTLFNIIDTTAGLKVDLIPLTMKPGYAFALANRIRRPIPVSSEVVTEAWFAKPEDVVVGKLMAWREGHSLKHEHDIRDILIATYLDDPEIAIKFDAAYVDQWVATLGKEVEDFWIFLQELSKLHFDDSTK
jgi:hypothetical protein